MLTATAVKHVREDISKTLKLNNPYIATTRWIDQTCAFNVIEKLISATILITPRISDYSD